MPVDTIDYGATCAKLKATAFIYTGINIAGSAGVGGEGTAELTALAGPVFAIAATLTRTLTAFFTILLTLTDCTYLASVGFGAIGFINAFIAAIRCVMHQAGCAIVTVSASPGNETVGFVVAL